MHVSWFDFAESLTILLVAPLEMLTAIGHIRVVAALPDMTVYVPVREGGTDSHYSQAAADGW